MGIGAFRHLVTFQAPGGSVPDGDGGFTEGWADLGAAWPVEIIPASVRDLETLTAGTVSATATHVITGRYRPDVTTAARVKFGDRIFVITGVQNVEERGIEMRIFAEERL